MAYLPRVVDHELTLRLQSSGAVLIEGSKACGKTETASQASNSRVDVDTDARIRELLALDPNLILEGAAPRLIDEWQLAPELWNYVRRAVDERRLTGQFILTGSAVPADDATRHSGAGRFSRLRMRPMSLFESEHSTGAISLRALLSGEAARSVDVGTTVRDIARWIVTGGWPGLHGATEVDAHQSVRDYLDQIRRVDVERVDGVRRDPNKVGALLRSLALNTATEVNVSTLSADAGGSEGPLSRHTTYQYLDALERVFILESQPAWAPHLRSATILRGSPKRHLVDPSLAAAALGATSSKLLADYNLLGFLFESLVMRELLVYAQPLGGEVFHYRDASGLEVDAIVATAEFGWAAFEVKLSPGSIDSAAASLLKFADRIDTRRSGKPVMLAVIVGTGYGYVRSDGVAVIPISAFGP